MPDAQFQWHVYIYKLYINRPIQFPVDNLRLYNSMGEIFYNIPLSCYNMCLWIHPTPVFTCLCGSGTSRGIAEVVRGYTDCRMPTGLRHHYILCIDRMIHIILVNYCDMSLQDAVTYPMWI